ncbi:MAG TPA: DNRLRE domain-containing protein [Acidimicrobiia bacterium]|nr:DNRLRE domain-containing protein [Acidimicrobiia bacterium]
MALAVGALLALAGAAGLVFASATTLPVTPKRASAFRTCVLTGYPTTSTAVADTWVDENAKTSNKAGGTIVQVTSRSGQNKRAFLRFDLTKCAPVLASTGSVKRATLRLYLSLRPASTRTYNVQRVATPCPESATTCWTEGGLTWNNQPSVSGTVTSNLSLTSTSPLQYYGWDVTADAAAFVAGTANNYGWRIADSAEGNATAVDAQFRTKNTASNAAGAPQLVITYTP